MTDAEEAIVDAITTSVNAIRATGVPKDTLTLALMMVTIEFAVACYGRELAPARLRAALEAGVRTLVKFAVTRH